jgi:hypothetical protein
MGVFLRQLGRSTRSYSQRAMNRSILKMEKLKWNFIHQTGGVLRTQKNRGRMSSSTDLKVWLKEEGAEGTAFSVFVRDAADVDELKDAIKNKIPGRVACDAPDLQIKENEGGDSLEEDQSVAVIIQTGVGQGKATPFFFAQPPGKLIFKP